VEQAVQALDRMRLAISGHGVTIPEGSLDASVSIGVAPWPSGVPFDDALAAADRALYRAKSQGRDQLQLAE
jgi:diguanylate cyclase (GGDEF)-like protein